MTNSTVIANLGDLAKPATVLIEKIADAISGIFLPAQIVRVARAEAQAALIRAEANAQMPVVQQRAIQRLIDEEVKKQENIEEVTRLALPQLTNEAKPESVENDWIVNFFDKCRLTSDHEFQALWSRVLAGEANSPGSFSRRTVNFVATLEKSDAEQFTALCSFGWNISDDKDIVPFVFDPQSTPTSRAA